MAMGTLHKYWLALKHVTVGPMVIILAVGVLDFPNDVDVPLTSQEVESTQKYYTEAYRKPVEEEPATSEYETKYIRVAEQAAKMFQIEDQVTVFVKRFNLNDRPVLEIGSGRGYLQDVAPNYTGLDISPTVKRFYHQNFVLGSATAMPFPNDSFDAVWSIWVFEHVPNPEQAFFEARRVTRDGGVLFLLPAWNCTPWAADGYQVRPYSDFDLRGKIIKATIPIRARLDVLALAPIRIVRSVVAWFGPTRLRYRRLKPNYDQYWMADSDAVNSIDRHEAMLWFLTRGDECLNCDSESVLAAGMPLIVRVHKQGGSPGRTH
jgi:SAM-dependent methyltransferase